MASPAHGQPGRFEREVRWGETPAGVLNAKALLRPVSLKMWGGESDERR